MAPDDTQGRKSSTGKKLEPTKKKMLWSHFELADFSNAFFSLVSPFPRSFPTNGPQSPQKKKNAGPVLFRCHSASTTVGIQLHLSDFDPNLRMDSGPLNSGSTSNYLYIPDFSLTDSKPKRQHKLSEWKWPEPGRSIFRGYKFGKETVAWQWAHSCHSPALWPAQRITSVFAKCFSLVPEVSLWKPPPGERQATHPRKRKQVQNRYRLEVGYLGFQLHTWIHYLNLFLLHPKSKNFVDSKSFINHSPKQMSPPFFGLGEGIVSIPITLVPSNNSRTAISLVINCPGKGSSETGRGNCHDGSV